MQNRLLISKSWHSNINSGGNVAQHRGFGFIIVFMPFFHDKLFIIMKASITYQFQITKNEQSFT